MSGAGPDLVTRMARGEADLRAAQRLRYEVFVEELGGDGPLVDHAARLERDAFDGFTDHLLLCDRARAPGEEVIAVYRLMRADQAAAAGGFYSASEFDLGPLERSGRRLLELGRSCLHRDYRGGQGMYLLWAALADYVAEHEIDILFGVASFHGTDPAPLEPALSLLHARHLAPETLRVRARAPGFQPMDILPEERIDRRAAMAQIPALIKGYLRLGGMVGEGAFIDRAFNTIDVCLILDTVRLDETRRRIYSRSAAG
ncbi:GNAT family N-acetyltransferase [Poseidonocella sedimentorum]|uniref:L-ornithine N(alpha)-acyltransferase n=1 Tax=Poseidonocella sedimentorum TaxID=871652 RepID=A0A1I6EI97_9RHOB|nr:GNAT family N-acyltransferase [Poseidonocella sedimentorum]SFR17470.1 Putative hemolysin [Poseidonocella sedimentorum]